jgi:3-oxoadipate enol-lactonase/4-carboxymuconolactone decarboxylase
VPCPVPHQPPPWPTYEIATPRLKISLRRSGNREGEKIVMLHGWAVHGGMFQQLRQYLEEGFDLLVPDLRGHGETDAPWDGYSLESLADDLLALLDQEGIERVHLLGYSWGGFVALAFAQRHPGRLHKLSLICTAPRYDALWRRVGMGLMGGLWTVLPPITMLPVTRHLLSGPGLPEGMGRVVGWLMSQNTRAGLAGGARGMRQADLRPGLRQLQVPTLLVTGGRDVAVHESDWKVLVSEIPRLVHHHFDDAGHGLAVSHTAALGAVLCEFLNDNSLSSGPEA